jgi:arylsulfatase
MTNRNIVLITADSIRADHCGFIGYGSDTTPTLDRLADDGLVFEMAVAPGPSTTQSMPAMFTGNYPVKRETATSSELKARREFFQPHMRARQTIPEQLARDGYETGGFTPNPYTSRFTGFDEGFDHFEDFISDSRSSFYDFVFEKIDTLSPVVSLARMGLNAVKQEEVFKPWENYYGEIEAWLSDAEEPYFLWVHLMDPHFPFLVPSEYRSQPWVRMHEANWKFWQALRNGTSLDDRTEEQLLTAYDDTIRYTDAFVERLYEDVADTDPVVIFHGDHGEGFGEHGSYSHGHDLYQENIHVPFLVSGVENDTVEAPVTLEELPGMIHALRQGDSLDSFGKPYVVSQTLDTSRVAVVGSSWKYIGDADSSTLYSLESDEQETIDNEDLLDLCETIDRQRTYQQDIQGATVSAVRDASVQPS